MMKWLLGAILLAAALWSGYWFAAAHGTRAAWEAWFAARRAEGWQADYAALSVRGFPNRIDVTLDAPALADPVHGLAWEAPFFQVFALSYKPHHVIAVWPPAQTFSTPEAHYAISSADMRASLVLRPAPALPLERANMVAGAMAIEGPRGTTTLEGIQLALARTEDAAAPVYHAGFNADGLAPPLPEGLTLRTGGRLPRALEALRADLELTFDRPWDITALSRGRPQPTRLRLKLAEARWGPLELALAGTLRIDKAGRPTGRLTVKARNWRDIVAIVRGMGLLPESWIDNAEEALSLAAQLSGNARTLDLPLDFADGAMSLGPIPLGAAPRIRLR